MKRLQGGQFKVFLHVLFAVGFSSKKKRKKRKESHLKGRILLWFPTKESLEDFWLRTRNMCPY